MMAVAVRSATGGNSALGVSMNTMSSAQGPLASSSARIATPTSSLAGALTGATGATPAVGTGAEAGGSGIESSLQQSQDLNMYYLQVQEAVSQENRQYSALSNVLKAKHDTVKTAIGNIR